MFEVGKLTDESLDSFISELGKVCDVCMVVSSCGPPTYGHARGSSRGVLRNQCGISRV